MAKRKKATKTTLPARRGKSADEPSQPLLEDLRSLIQQARERVSRAVNSALVGLYWEVGHRIYAEVLKSKRAEYGEEIVSTLSAQLGWSHFVEIMPIQALRRF